MRAWLTAGSFVALVQRRIIGRKKELAGFEPGPRAPEGEKNHQKRDASFKKWWPGT